MYESRLFDVTNKFYTFHQNNSGGCWSKPAHYVIIEAPSQNVAEAIAEDNGLYFDGVRSGLDCPCCGDRWHSPEKGTKKPLIYGQKPDSADYIFSTTKAIPYCLVIHQDGQKDVIK